jgi:hypothetical protein
MSDFLIAIHIGYVVALVWFVWRSGFKAGRKDLVEELLDANLVSEDTLIKHYAPKDS